MQQYNYSVINYIVIIRSEDMAFRDHSLDDKIIIAAKKEFSEKGYSGASLRRIAEKAGATVGGRGFFCGAENLNAA